MPGQLSMLAVLCGGCHLAFPLDEEPLPPVPVRCPSFGPESQIKGLPAGTPSALNTAMRDDRLEVYYVNGTVLALASRGTTDGIFGYQPIQFENVDSYSPTLTDDGLSLVFVSDRNGTPELYETTRTDTGLPFTTLRAPGAFGDLRAIDVSGDGLVLFYVAGAERTLGQLVRPTRDNAFEARPFPANTKPVHDIAMSADGLTLYFHRDASIYAWNRSDENAPFDEIDRVVVSQGTYPDLSRDGETLTFVRNSQAYEVRCDE